MALGRPGPRVLRPRRSGLRRRTRGQLRGAQGATPALGLPWSALSWVFYFLSRWSYKARVGLVTATLLADPSR